MKTFQSSPRAAFQIKVFRFIPLAVLFLLVRLKKVSCFNQKPIFEREDGGKEAQSFVPSSHSMIFFSGALKCKHDFSKTFFCTDFP